MCIAVLPAVLRASQSAEQALHCITTKGCYDMLPKVQVVTGGSVAKAVRVRGLRLIDLVRVMVRVAAAGRHLVLWSFGVRASGGGRSLASGAGPTGRRGRPFLPHPRLMRSSGRSAGNGGSATRCLGGGGGSDGDRGGGSVVPVVPAGDESRRAIPSLARRWLITRSGRTIWYSRSYWAQRVQTCGSPGK